MDKHKNEEGYALLTVLLIITLFMVLFLAFTGQAFNTVKQNKIIEKSSQSVALAEMGVTYYEKAIQNVYFANITEIINEIDALRKKQINGTLTSDELAEDVKPLYQDKLLNNDDFIKIARDRLLKKINCSLNELSCTGQEKILLKQTIAGKTESEFEINKKDGQSAIVISEGNAMIKSDFISIGKENGDPTTIGATLKIDFSDIVPGNTIKDPDPNGNLLKKCDDINPKLTNFTNVECQYSIEKHFANNDKLEFNNSTVRVNGDFSFGNLNNENVKSTLYIDGNMNTGNMNSFETLNLHVTGDATFGNFTGSGLAKSIIEIDGSTTFENVKLKESDIYISSLSLNLPNLGKILEMEQSSIYVNSGAIFEDINIGASSTICVNGELSFKNPNSAKISGTGKVYARESTHSDVITNQTEFDNACTKFAWGTASFTADYDYTYQ
jgi:hypothetical protein